MDGHQHPVEQLAKVFLDPVLQVKRDRLSTRSQEGGEMLRANPRSLALRHLSAAQIVQRVVPPDVVDVGELWHGENCALHEEKKE